MSSPWPLREPGEEERIRPGIYVPFDEISAVRIMAIADNYAMVRRKSCSPFVVPLTELRQRVRGADAAVAARTKEE